MPRKKRPLKIFWISMWSLKESICSKTAMAVLEDWLCSKSVWNTISFHSSSRTIWNCFIIVTWKNGITRKVIWWHRINIEPIWIILELFIKKWFSKYQKFILKCRYVLYSTLLLIIFQIDLVKWNVKGMIRNMRVCRGVWISSMVKLR